MSKKSFMPRTDEKRREWLNANVDRLQNGADGIGGKYKIAGTTIAQLDSGRQWANSLRAAVVPFEQRRCPARCS